MTDTQGLRFDIYERVHLPEQVKGIEQLDQIELLPNIRVLTQGDQAVLTGHLTLTGQYGGDARSGGKLEHAIPVEITLPLNRVPDLDQVRVDIEHFDVDVIAPGTLNVIGVLSLRGIVTEPYVRDRQEVSEETVFVHERLSDATAAGGNDASLERGDVSAVGWGAARESGNEPTRSEEGAKESVKEKESAKDGVKESAKAGAEPKGKDLLAQPPFHQSPFHPKPQKENVPQEMESASSPFSGNGPKEKQTSANTAVPADGSWTPEADGGSLVSESLGPPPSNEPAPAQENTFGGFDVNENIAYETDANLSLEGTDDSSERTQAEPEETVQPKTEPKVALSGRKPDGGQALSASELTSLLQKSSQIKGARSEPDAEALSADALNATGAPPADRDADAGAEKLEWKKLFLSRGEEERPFASVRLCIVQKEETIESIAERYQLNPREIALYNGLGSQELQEGQVLYIPK